MALPVITFAPIQPTWDVANLCCFDAKPTPYPVLLRDSCLFLEFPMAEKSGAMYAPGPGALDGSTGWLRNTLSAVFV